MDKCETSDFQLIRNFPKSRAPLPRMIGPRHQLEISPDDHEGEDTSDEDEEDAVEESYDDVDASARSREYERVNFEYKPMERYHNVKKHITPTKDPKKTFQQQTPKMKPVRCTPRNIFWCVFIFLMPVLIALVIMINNSKANSTTNETVLYQSKINLMKDLEQNIDSVSQVFEKQSPEIWIEFKAGIAEVISYPNKPAIFVLFANQDDTMLCLAKMIANASKAAVGSDNNLWLSASDMGNDYGIVINKFKNKIEEQKIVIVDNLLNINSKALLAFHHLCDKENPLVKKAIYIITMVAKGYSKELKPIQFVENQLLHKMKDTINKDKLQPLITRITDGPIILVQPEPSLHNCPLRY